MVSDLGQAAQRLGPARFDVIRVVVGGGGDELQILVLHLTFAAERHVGTVVVVASLWRSPAPP